MRTLPFCIAPLPGEALDAWLETLAAYASATWADITNAVGLPRAAQHPLWIIEPTAAQRAAASSALGVGAADIASMTLSRYNGTALRINHPVTSSPWGRRTWQSRFCPECLAETDGRWLLRWRLGFSFACLRHRCLLVDLCPHCQQPQRCRMLPSKTTPVPGYCAVGARPTSQAPRCGADLTAADTVSLPEGHLTLHAQHIIDTIIDEGAARFGVYGPSPVPSLTALTDLRSLGLRALRYLPEADLNEAGPHIVRACQRRDTQGHDGRTRDGLAPAKRDEFMATVERTALAMTLAVRILDQSSIDDAGTAARPLIDALRQRKFRTGGASTPTGWSPQTSLQLRALIMAARRPHMGFGEQIRHRILSPDRPLSHSPTARPPSDYLAKIPQLLWTSWALRLELPYGYVDRQRGILAAALLIPDTRLTLPQVADIIGANPFGTQPNIYSAHELVHDEAWPNIYQAILAMTDHLRGIEVPIDYRRRCDLDYDALLPEATWRTISADHGLRYRAQGDIVARTYLAERISAARPATGDLEMEKRVRKFPIRLTPHIADRLNRYACAWLRERGIDEPVTWEPDIAVLDHLDLPGHDPRLVDIDQVHDYIRAAQRMSLTAAAAHFHTSASVIRYLLETHPAPPRVDSWRDGKRRNGAYAAAKAAYPEAKLRRLHLDHGLSIAELGRRIGADPHTMGRLTQEYDINVRSGANRGPRPRRTKQGPTET